MKLTANKLKKLIEHALQQNTDMMKIEREAKKRAAERLYLDIQSLSSGADEVAAKAAPLIGWPEESIKSKFIQFYLDNAPEGFEFPPDSEEDVLDDSEIDLM